MKQLRVSAAFNLHRHSRENLFEYVREGLRFYKQAGFDAIDFGTTFLDLGSDAWKPQVEQILKNSQEMGISFEIGHLPFMGGGGVKDEAYLKLFNEKMHRAIDAAAQMGLRYAVMHPNASTLPLRQYDHDEQYDLVMGHLSPFVEHAAKVGLNVLVENMRVVTNVRYSHRYGQSPEDLCEIADGLGIGVCWDFGHANISGLKQSESLAYIGKRLKVIHVNDNVGIDDEHILPFTGNIDWRDAMHGLALTEFDGLFNFELNTSRVPVSMRDAYASYVLAAARELMSYIE